MEHPTGTPQQHKTAKRKNRAKPKRTGCKQADLFLILDDPTISPRAWDWNWGTPLDPLLAAFLGSILH